MEKKWRIKTRKEFPLGIPREWNSYGKMDYLLGTPLSEKLNREVNLNHPYTLLIPVKDQKGRGEWKIDRDDIIEIKVNNNYPIFN